MKEESKKVGFTHIKLEDKIAGGDDSLGYDKPVGKCEVGKVTWKLPGFTGAESSWKGRMKSKNGRGRLESEEYDSKLRKWKCIN